MKVNKLIDGKEPTGILGDVNDSGAVNQVDADLLQQYLNHRPGAEIDENNADIHQEEGEPEGTINMHDLTDLQRMIDAKANVQGEVVRFKLMSETDFKQQETFDTHTFTITNKDGVIAENFNEEQSASLYVGATKLTDIVVMNDIPGLTQFLAVQNNILVGVPNNFSAALGNPDKLYVWYNSDSWYIFVYNPKNHTYMQLGASVRTDGSGQVNDSSSQLNYVSSKADVSDSSKYISKTWVYYPQSSS